MDEYVKRAAIMEFPIRKDHCDKERANEHFIFGIESVLEYVENLPAADVAPVVHGHFVHDGPRFAHGVDWWHCSNCGRLASGVETRFDYCPWCGARMDGDEREAR